MKEMINKQTISERIFITKQPPSQQQQQFHNSDSLATQQRRLTGIHSCNVQDLRSPRHGASFVDKSNVETTHNDDGLLSR
jgi:hypothetical protein